MLGVLSDVGNVRKTNEDSVGYFECSDFGIYAVADGMGGHNAGEVASELAIKVIIEYVKANQYGSDLKEVLSEGIKHANKKIYDMASEDDSLKGMGTTITICFKKQDRMVVANVGDSSCYVIDNKRKLSKITRDHSLVQQLLDNGTITEEKARNHPNKNIITRALGTNEEVEVDLFDVDLTSVIKCILCTDGLTNDVTYDEMYDIIIKNDNDSSCKMLVDLSKSKGGRDNISVIVFEGECRDDRNHVRE
ncbi:Stp1/IreP family PP2C-type Ser/Thr phosphatase [Clostridium tagluense]|uniref:Stp1/IreP family PP2C-type Ser/Thr phosphatase n=1 Tax=Clostridium tagluense TaxID=360422 RepID=UPI001C0CD95C|nr:Stp1/IreP family PP2C-type Ser/Thr phosphatase [Clostridium tagluense]MBU3126522.1 Stp1/IreP family PP2C-type Ser/Thr phosphatase [Clostridium tagluense]MBW9156358.1 Stp1/IreP family PP2C-type Ser/Thr phosphatase [Clostridium tagluense]MCB2309890.1 Stp1/IreP family PP2C-type Ser/Thr phosphatase [Clostridium tagluense]MCB2314580.1 Stp1/IreP family PP2C-type Ser/Thr phosphatase [Clostridium tagluense]MCB2319428.1 Stp1/IreP family PP2C-type Ser/Thr phosphatase [Clostridium tagluense]